MSFSILGTGKAVPEYVLTNDELSTMVETSDEWISTRTGIKRRHICKSETITELCIKASNEAMQNAGVSAKDLDLIICATLRGEYITPSQACVIQKELGATCPAFDINAACSGFIYALDVADGFFARGRVKKVLVVALDNLSNIVDWKDRNTCVLFGDGGGAAVLGEGDGLKYVEITAKGDTSVLQCPHGENTSPFYEHPSKPPYLYMNGPEVYKFAVVSMVRGIRNAIRKAGLTEEEIDWVIPHQANIRIIETAVSKLKIPSERFIRTISEYGNTSGGSCAIALADSVEKGLFKKGDNIVFCAFGAGLTTGSCVITWDKD